MDMKRYQQLARRTRLDYQIVADRLNPTRLFGQTYPSCRRNSIELNKLLHAAVGITGESGEIASAVEHVVHYGHKLDKTNLVEELGDLMWYISLACDALDVSLEDVLEKNIAKLKTRYPEKYSSENALEENRDRAAEREAVEQNGNGWAEPPEDTETV